VFCAFKETDEKSSVFRFWFVRVLRAAQELRTRDLVIVTPDGLLRRQGLFQRARG
jgi:hypothetical protein